MRRHLAGVVEQFGWINCNALDQKVLLITVVLGAGARMTVLIGRMQGSNAITLLRTLLLLKVNDIL